MNDGEVPDRIKQTLATWNKQRWRWTRLRYTLGIGGIAFSAVITPINSSYPDLKWLVNFLSMGAAILTGVLTFSKANEKANALSKACRLLNMQCTKYELDHSIDTKILLEAVQQGESLIESAD
jgi:hypothetical protein